MDRSEVEKKRHKRRFDEEENEFRFARVAFEMPVGERRRRCEVCGCGCQLWAEGPSFERRKC